MCPLVWWANPVGPYRRRVQFTLETSLKSSPLLPEVLIGVGAQRFAAIANRVLTPKTTPAFSIDHLHQPLVSVAEQATKVVEHLRIRICA